jgi:hypothetical protein
MNTTKGDLIPHKVLHYPLLDREGKRRDSSQDIGKYATWSVSGGSEERKDGFGNKPQGPTVEHGTIKFGPTSGSARFFLIDDETVYSCDTAPA